MKQTTKATLKYAPGETVEFEPNDWLEAQLLQRARDPVAFAARHSLPERLSLDAYARAKAQHERRPPRPITSEPKP